jgi:uncharacterized protein YfaS (alpha-2-macroglobulin family)
LQDKVSVLLTTEKPIYQPGQTIHVRALALDRSNHEAVGNRDLLFEVEDSRGNKVFKKATRTDEFGIASAEFGLADEVNLGTYHLRALLGEAGSESANSAEIALSVESYVLPKFKVDIDLAGRDERAKHGYRPGDHVSGTIRAHYFFGKALEGAEVGVKATAMDVRMSVTVGSRWQCIPRPSHAPRASASSRLPHHFPADSWPAASKINSAPPRTPAAVRRRSATGLPSATLA